MAQNKCVQLSKYSTCVIQVLKMFTIWFDCLHTRSNVFIMRLVSRQNQSQVFSGVVVKVIMFLTNQTTDYFTHICNEKLSQHFVIGAFTFPQSIASLKLWLLSFFRILTSIMYFMIRFIVYILRYYPDRKPPSFLCRQWAHGTWVTNYYVS